jgi:GT2 family glycosyltransferase
VIVAGKDGLETCRLADIRLLDERKTMTSVEKVSVIIPTGGRTGPLSECLGSIQRYPPDSEIIVIGNKNDERTERVLLEKFPSVRYLECEESSAVVKRNMGIALASNDILIFVDDDVVVDSAWRENLLRHYGDDSVAAVGGRVEIPGLKRGTSNYRTGVIEDGFVIGNWNPAATEAFEVQHLLGCNMSFRKAPVIRLGGFDNFFRACNFREETDLCLRIRRLGYRIVFDPNANLVHKALGRRSQGARWIYYYIRNSVYLYMKYQFKSGLPAVRFFRRLIFPPKDYAALSGVKVSITPITLFVVSSGIISGFLGYLGHREPQTLSH